MSKLKKELKNQFLIKKYESFTGVLSRIKQDEKNWISILILVFGGFFAFSFSLASQEMNIVSNLGSISSISLYILFISVFIVYWLHEAFNLRIQYYRTMLRIDTIELELAALLGTTVSVPFNKSFCEWYVKTTRPYESRITTHVLPLLLSLGSSILYVYLSYSRMDVSYIERVIAFSIVVLSVLVINTVLFLYYQAKDKKQLAAIHEKHVNEIQSLV